MNLKRGDIRAPSSALLCCFLIEAASVFCGEPAPAGHSASRYDPALMMEARLQKSAGLAEEAIKSYSLLLMMARADHHQRDETECLMALGTLFWNEGDIEKSAKRYSEALWIAKENRWPEQREFCENALHIIGLYKAGKSFRDGMRYDAAEKSYLEAIGTARRIRSPDHEAKCLRQMSIVYYYTMEWDRFYLANKAAFDVAEKNSLVREKAHSAFNIAYFYLKTARYHKAYVIFESARKIYRQLGSEEDEAECDHNMALIHYGIGDYGRALRTLRGIAQTTNDDGLKTAVLISMGNAAKKLALLEEDRHGLFEAASHYRRALELAIRRQDGFYETVALNNLGYFYYDLKKWPLALSYFNNGSKASARIPNVELKCTVTANLANVHLKLKDYEAAEKFYENAMRLLHPEKHQAVLWEIYFGLGVCYQKKGESETALSFYIKAMEMLEGAAGDIRAEQGRTHYLFNKYEVYEAAIRLLFDAHRTGSNDSDDARTMVSIIDRLKSRTLLDFLIKKYYSRPNASEGNAERGRFEGANSDVAGFFNDDRGALLTGRTAVVMYFIGETISLSLVITAGNIQCFRLPPKDELEKTIKNYLKLLSDPPRGDFLGTAAAHKIFNQILAPIHESSLAGIKHIVVIPDGALNYLPFETLVIRSGDGKPPVYIMEDYGVSYAPSLSSLLLLSRHHAVNDGPGKILVVGKSDYREYARSPSDEYVASLQAVYAKAGFTINPLRGVLKEIRGISSNIKRGKVTIKLNDEADEEFLKNEDLSQYRIIHFSCHGLIDEYSPMRSALILTREKGSHEDGHLQVHEISGLGLKADLVVLSACQTGRGGLSRGEGIMGLTKAFFYAGARSVLSALWNVNDESTAVFMRHFYSHLARGLPKNEALRRAKLAMIKSGFSHPYYWAPFVLSGDYASSCRLH